MGTPHLRRRSHLHLIFHKQLLRLDHTIHATFRFALHHFPDLIYRYLPISNQMRFFKKLAGILGFFRDDHHDPNAAAAAADDEDDDDDGAHDADPRHRRVPKGPFSVQVPALADRPSHLLGPVLAPCNSGDGGVQGLKWYAKRLRVDEDGDVADEFLDEVLPDASELDDHKPMPRFVAKDRTRPVKVRNQIMMIGGNVLQSIEYKGGLQWV